ncbi:exodeoxyribonuclease I [Neptuniibacter sp. QD37_11]|uniref:exodeoxyribonuclease I n=1 Tax=Neptuniibacter sp. QD37_11 TaxID=3398209 RepID=UPI0039F61F12
MIRKQRPFFPASPNTKIFTFYDYETTGINSKYDQAVQFASANYDAQTLEKIPGSEVNIFCKLRPDVVPNPYAFKVTHIDPVHLERNGLNELEFAKQVKMALSGQGKCNAGYNSIRFDDEVTRNLFYRNLYDPYEHEWRHRNHRTDIFYMMQAAYAICPEILEWPTTMVDGKETVSLKLENLSQANGIIHENAHDALSDIYATAGMAKLVKEANPRFFDYMMGMSVGDNVKKLLCRGSALVNISGFNGKDNHFVNVIKPLKVDKYNSKKYICVDLTEDLTEMWDLTPEEMRQYMFTKRTERPALAPKIAGCTIQTNKCPMLFPAESVLTAERAARWGDLNLDRINKNLELLSKDNDVGQRLMEAYNGREWPSEHVMGDLYGGFFEDHQKDSRARLLSPVPAKNNEPRLKYVDALDAALKMDDDRHVGILLHAKYGNYLNELVNQQEYSPAELRLYVEFLEERLTQPQYDGDLTLDSFNEACNAMDMEFELTGEEKEIIKKLRHHVEISSENFEALKGLVSSPQFQMYADQELAKDPNKIALIDKFRQRYTQNTEEVTLIAEEEKALETEVKTQQGQREPETTKETEECVLDAGF